MSVKFCLLCLELTAAICTCTVEMLIRQKFIWLARKDKSPEQDLVCGLHIGRSTTDLLEKLRWEVFHHPYSWNLVLLPSFTPFEHPAWSNFSHRCSATDGYYLDVGFPCRRQSYDSGSDLIAWMIKNLDVEDQTEALHLGHLMSAHGYFFPIDDHVLTIKADGTFYRFQTPYFWPSNCWEPENTDYAVYLCKRTMQNKTRLELADYEAENLARLQKMFSRKWEFIFMQAEAQAKVDKKRDKLERKVLDSQERAFWDVHRPVPGCVNTTEMDIKKACRMNKPIKSAKIQSLKHRLDRRNVKISKVADSYIHYFEQYQEYDPFLVTPEPSNPWISDSVDFWELEKQTKDIPARRVRRWAFSLKELLKDPAGREQFFKFLEKEFSAENLKFWDAVQELKQVHSRDIPRKVQDIWNEYLAPEANCPINIDSKSYEITKRNVEEKPDRWAFEEAAAHLYQLMNSDKYSRYLRSEMYKEYLNGMKKKTSVKGIRSVISFSGKKEQTSSSS